MECNVNRNSVYFSVLLPGVAPPIARSAAPTGEDISKTSTVRQQGMCVMCGKPTNRSPRALYCKTCATEKEIQRRKAYLQSHKEQHAGYCRKYREKCKQAQKQNETSHFSVQNQGEKTPFSAQKWEDKSVVLASVPQEMPLRDFLSRIN